jgi:colanic acid/amylovoran biosynthesis protein
MNVEVLGVDPANKGAGLMFEAIRQQLNAKLANVNYAMALGADDRRSLGVLGAFSRKSGKKNRLLRAVGQRLPRVTLRAFGMVPERDIDVFLDASGFAYGDFWGPEKMASRMARHIAAWRRSGKKVIFLPQAWGPFENPKFRPLLDEIFAHAHLVFARDEVSLRHLHNAVGARPSLHLAPDFTNLVKAETPGRLKQHAGQSFIVPNAKMIEAKGEAFRERYIDFLMAAVNAAHAAQQSPAFLIHEGARDFDIATEVNARLISPIEIVAGLSPLETKALIGHAGTLVSSRFHGLVSALSAGVPSLACGWSHKYTELLHDYGCPENVIDLSTERDPNARLEAFFQAALSNSAKERIGIAGQEQRARSGAMWDKVFRVLGTA